MLTPGVVECTALSGYFEGKEMVSYLAIYQSQMYSNAALFQIQPPRLFCKQNDQYHRSW